MYPETYYNYFALAINILYNMCLKYSGFPQSLKTDNVKKQILIIASQLIL